MNNTTRGILIFSLLAASGVMIGAAAAQTQTAPPAHLSLHASAILVRLIQAEDAKLLPPEFQMSMYENMIQQIAKTNRFEHIYRDGDRTADAAPDLVILQSTVTGYKKGSAEARQVTTVTGATSIAVHLKFTDKSDKVLLENDVKGKVIFLGENLRATYDFGKKVAHVVRDNFAAATPKSK